MATGIETHVFPRFRYAPSGLRYLTAIEAAVEVAFEVAVEVEVAFDVEVAVAVEVDFGIPHGRSRKSGREIGSRTRYV
jgi:hypothetical protein